MTEAQTISFRCPPEVLEAMQLRMTATGQKQSTVIINALRHALGLTGDRLNDQAHGTDPAILQRMSDLEGLVRQHDHLVPNLAKLERRVRDLEAKATTTSANAMQNNAVVMQAENNPMDLPQATSAGKPWYTVEQAFESLGGIPTPESGTTVPTLDGSKRVKWNSFRLARQTKYDLYGFGIDEERRAEKLRDFLFKLESVPTPPNDPTLFDLLGGDNDEQ